MLLYIHTNLSQDGGFLPGGDPDGLLVAAAGARRRVTRRGGTGRTLLPRSARLANQKRALQRSIPLPSVNRQTQQEDLIATGSFCCRCHWMETRVNATITRTPPTL